MQVNNSRLTFLCSRHLSFFLRLSTTQFHSLTNFLFVTQFIKNIVTSSFFFSPTGIKQYLCQTCNYNGVTQSDLNRHCKTRSHLLRSSNVCPLCSLGFSTRTLLEEHLVKFHDTTSSTASVLSLKSSTTNNSSPLAVTAAPTMA